MCSARGSLRISSGGFPHSDISGSKPADGSPKLFAVNHVLHRLLTPRHPPCTLCSLITRVSFGFLELCSFYSVVNVLPQRLLAEKCLPAFADTHSSRLNLLNTKKKPGIPPGPLNPTGMPTKSIVFSAKWIIAYIFC